MVFAKGELNVAEADDTWLGRVWRARDDVRQYLLSVYHVLGIILSTSHIVPLIFKAYDVGTV